MLPVCLFTVSTPPATSHLAGEWSWVDTHSFSSWPLKRMMASEGASRAPLPGVTTLGTGFQTSVSSGRGAGFCAINGATAANIRTALTASGFMTESPFWMACGHGCVHLHPSRLRVAARLSVTESDTMGRYQRQQPSRG